MLRPKNTFVLPAWVGALSMLLVVYAPAALAASVHLWTPGSQTNSIGAIVFLIPGLALIATLAPLVGYRRRTWLLALIPIYGVGFSLIFGGRLAELTNRRPDVSKTADKDRVAAGT